MLLSICIPSYNRFNELKLLLDSISDSESQEFDVFVIDNGSEEDLFQLGKYDKRFNFIKRDVIVPGPVSIRTSLNYGDAKYIMLCLDKDLICGEYLDQFLKKLKENASISCGYCLLNSNIVDGKIVINNEPIENKIYRCGHPSGYFIRKDIIDKATNAINPLDTNNPLYNNPFLSDLVYAYGLLEGEEGIYSGSLIYPESQEKAGETKSYTYTTQNKNIYFMPECKRKQMFLFIGHLETLGLSTIVKRKIIGQLFKRTMSDCTFGFKHIMRNKQICEHHSITCQRVTVRQMLKEAIILSKEFKVSETIVYGSLYKNKTILKSWIVLLIKIILGK